MEINILTLKSKKLKYILLMIFFSIFILSTQIRIYFWGQSLGTINYLAALLLVLLILKYNKNINHIYLIYFILISIYVFTINIYYDGFQNTIYTYISFILPLILIDINIEENIFDKIFKNLIVIINIIIFIITLTGIIDYFTNYELISFLCQYMSVRIGELIELQKRSEIYRMYSFMGHPLFNTELYLIFYLFNTLYNKFYTKKILPNSIIIIFSLLGISMTASKTGFFLIIISLFLVNNSRKNNKKKFLTYLMIVILVIIIFKIGIFQNVIDRLQNGSLTTGRSEQWEVIKKFNIYPIKFWRGYGNGFTFKYNEVIPWASAAFEYPFRMFSLELGIFTMINIYFCLLVYPIIRLISRKSFSLVVPFIILFIDVNTYNGLALNGDYMFIFCIFIFCILNLSKKLRKNKFELYKSDI
nr:hypothetical protein CPBEC1_23440 [Clostridium perfringens]